LLSAMVASQILVLVSPLDYHFCRTIRNGQARMVPVGEV
jgi:hypothetical protein